MSLTFFCQFCIKIIDLNHPGMHRYFLLPATNHFLSEDVCPAESLRQNTDFVFLIYLYQLLSGECSVNNDERKVHTFCVDW
jgi:hypothetical protein